MAMTSAAVSAGQTGLASQYNSLRNDVIARWFIGEFKLWSTGTSPSAQWLVCDGSAVSRTTYAALFGVIGTTYGVGDGSTTFNLPPPGRVLVPRKAATSLGAATISNASPGVVTKTAHGLADGNQVYFTTTGALPTGLTASTKYFVKNASANTFEVAATLGGTSINTSSAGSGTHTLFSADFDTVGQTGGENNHTLTTPEIPSHTHATGNTSPNATAAPVAISSGNNTSNGSFNTQATGGGLSHNNIQEYSVALLLICADNT